MGLGLTSRKNLCIHPEVRWGYFSGTIIDSPFLQVAKEKKGKVVDARCRDLTSSSVCEKGRANPGSVELCDWHEVFSSIHCGSRTELSSQNLGKMDPGSLIPPGIWTLADVLQYGRDKGVCPYFAVRRMVICFCGHHIRKPLIL